MTIAKGISGDALRSWIEKIDPSIKDLQHSLNMPARTYYDLYKKKIVPWSTVARIHGVLREKHVYDINQFFPDFDKMVSHLIPEDESGEHTRLIKALRRDNELLQAKVIDLSEKLNAAYEKIIDGSYEKMMAIIEQHTAVLDKILNSIESK